MEEKERTSIVKLEEFLSLLRKGTYSVKGYAVGQVGEKDILEKRFTIEIVKNAETELKRDDVSFNHKCNVDQASADKYLYPPGSILDQFYKNAKPTKKWMLWLTENYRPLGAVGGHKEINLCPWCGELLPTERNTVREE